MVGSKKIPATGAIRGKCGELGNVLPEIKGELVVIPVEILNRKQKARAERQSCFRLR